MIMNEESKNSFAQSLTIPAAIVVAGVLIAGAVLFSNKNNPRAAVAGNNPAAPITEASFKPIAAEDHILGSPSAPIVILEFSDTECPFCKNFHATMHRIIDEYGKNGQVAWVYRHFPLDAIHPKTRKEAEATECAAELGGTVKFWEYIDRVFELTPSNDGLDPKFLPQIADSIGLDKNAFVQCLESGRHAQTVEAQYQDALASGGEGTPHNFIIAGDNILPLYGAQPYASVKSAIDAILATIK